MGDCEKYPDSDKEDEQKCYPHIHNRNKNVLVQDNYNLFSGKSDLVQNLLDHKIPIFFNKTEYSKDDELTNSFYESKNEDILTIDFMNIQVVSLKAITNSDSIESIAYRMNQFLSKYIKEGTKFHNHWFVLDYPTNDLVRKIYKSIDSSTLNKRNEISNVVQIDGFVIYTDFDYYIVSAENACLQRRTVKTQQGYEEEFIKSNYKCVDNKKNKWRIMPKDNYYNIKSSYDAKCLSYSKSRLSMSYCDDSQSKQFSIKNGKICLRSGNYCLDSKFQIQPTIIKPIRYEYLTCSSNYLKAGYKCCRNQYAKVEKVDDIGNWAKENGEWCGIGYERCSFEVLGYHCCSSVNPKVVKEDSYGKWGEEDGELCGIGEMNRVVLFRIRNVKTKQCILVNNSDGNLIDLGECTTSNHSLWHVTNVDEYNNKRITSDKNGKCLFAANACTSGLEVCENVMNIKDRYMHFEFVEDKYLCVKNNRNQKYNCLSSKTLNFEETYDKNDQSFQWEIQDIDGGVITRKETDPYNPDRNHDLPKDSPDNTSTSDCPVDDYPCCSPEITEVAYTDEKGTWGIENDGWCFISGSTSTPKSSEPTTTVNTTTTTISSTVSTSSKATPTIKSGHTVYWFYHAFTNKCLYAPQEPNNSITVKPCDDTDYSKWMVLPSRKGYFYSMAQPNYCLRVSNVDTGPLELGKCDEQAKLEHTDDGFFELIGSADKCIGFLDMNDMYNNEIKMNLNVCAKNDDEKFFNWDHNPTPVTVCFSEALGYPCCSDPNAAVATTDEFGQWGIENNEWCGILGSETNVPTLTPTINTETYYLYNSANSPITLAYCDYSTYSLWDIPYTHNGHFHLKFDNTHCIMLSDDESLVLGECGDSSTIFYRDGNFIKSPIYTDKCVGLVDTYTLGLTECNEFDTNQIFYFNLWTDEPLEPIDN